MKLLTHLKVNILPEEYLAVFALLLASAVSSYVGTKLLTLNPDALINGYVFKNGPLPHGLLMAEWHTNLLKWPFAYIQSLFPFNIVSFTITNFLLYTLMLLGWAFASAVALGRRYFYIVSLLLAVLAAGSFYIFNQTAFTFTRNIEYPLYFLSIILFWKIYAGIHLRTRQWWQLVTYYGLVTTILMASDPYAIYAITPALLVIVIFKSIRRLPKMNLFLPAASLAVAPVILSKILIRLLMFTHLFQYYGAQLNQPLHQFSQIPVWTWNALGDVVTLFNGNEPFGEVVSVHELNNFILCIFMLLCIAAFYVSVKKTKPYISTNPPYATLLIASIVLFGIYVAISGFEGQQRFLVLPVLVACTALAVWAQPVVSKLSRQQVLSFVIILVVGVICLLPFSYHEVNNTAPTGLRTTAAYRGDLNNIVADLESHNVNTIVSGYTYATTLQFASHGKFHIVPLLFCNQNLPFLTLLNWYEVHPYTTKEVALVVDKNNGGRDAGSWQCSYQSIFNFYGKPLSESVMPGLDGVNINIYYYPSAIINKVNVIKTSGTPVPSLPQ